MTLGKNGEKQFAYPVGRTLPLAPETHSRGNVSSLKAANLRAHLQITPKTLLSNWRGERMDLGLAVDALLAREPVPETRPD